MWVGWIALGGAITISWQFMALVEMSRLELRGKSLATLSLWAATAATGAVALGAPLSLLGWLLSLVGAEAAAQFLAITLFVVLKVIVPVIMLAADRMVGRADAQEQVSSLLSELNEGRRELPVAPSPLSATPGSGTTDEAPPLVR